MVPVLARLFDTSGAALGGVTVSGPGLTSATSDSLGQVTLSIPGGPRLQPGAHADRIRHAVSRARSDDAAPRVDLFRSHVGFHAIPLAPFDATKGGTLTARDGATITLPASALVDSTGKPISGAITIAMTPVNPTTSSGLKAFPGQYAGVTPDAKSNLLLSNGTTEYALYQGSNRLQLAPGATRDDRNAAIRQPQSRRQRRQRSADTIPLWSASDENTGSWIQEGTGTIVASTGSPSGLSLHAEVSHFSWWNSDNPWLKTRLVSVKCQCRNGRRGLPAIIGMAAFTCHLFRAAGYHCHERVDDARCSRLWPTRSAVARGALLYGPNGAGFNVPLNIPRSAWFASAFAGALTASQTNLVFTGSQTTELIFSLRPLTPGATQTVLSDTSVTLPLLHDAVATVGLWPCAALWK